MSLTSYRAAPSRANFGSFLSGYEPDEAFVLSKLSRRVCNKRGLLDPAPVLAVSCQVLRLTRRLCFANSFGEFETHAGCLIPRCLTCFSRVCEGWSGNFVSPLIGAFCVKRD